MRNTKFYSSNKINNNFNRTWLMATIVGLGLLIIVLLSYFVINDSKTDSARFVFNAIIPLIASWIGTVLAFYFGRENYEAATEQVLALSRENLDDINVENIMINVKTIVAQKVDEGKENEPVLKEIIELYNKVEKDRIPIFTTNLIPRYIIHRNTMVEYLSTKAGATEPVKLEQMLKGKEDYFGYNQDLGFVTVSKTDTVQHTLEKMNTVKGCQDVFVTDTGDEKGKVLGWLTNTLINRFLTIKES